jgi:phosphonate transport system substrate-binding protein
VKLIEQGNVDIAAVAPKMFASLRSKASPYHYMATFKIIDNEGYKQCTYRSLILTRAKETIYTLEDLKGKVFGFTDPSSTSGYAYPRFIMRQAGINPDTAFSNIFMLKKHTKIISALLEGSIDAGATYENILTTLPKATQDKIRILSISEEIPYGAILASDALDSSTRQTLRAALLAFESPQTNTNSIVGFEEKPLLLYDRLLLLTE